MKIKVAKTRFTTLCFNELVVRQSHIFVVQGIRFFSIGNSQLNCQIIESIFDMSLVYLHAYMCACSVIHVTRICCFEFHYLKFSFGYLENFSLSTLRKIFRKFNDFSWKTCENKGRISFALLLHNTVWLFASSHLNMGLWSI